MRSVRVAASAACLAAALAACSRQSYSPPKDLPQQLGAVAASVTNKVETLAGSGGGNPPAPAPAPEAPPAPAAVAAPAAPGGLSLQAVNAAQLGSNPPPASGSAASEGAAAQPDPVLIKAEVLLDRANVSPGVIDGKDGENFQNALVAFDKMHGLPESRTLSPQAWQALTADTAPVLKTYQITQEDEAGPWSDLVGEDFVKMSKQTSLGYNGPDQMLAARFHMDLDLLKALNPGVDFGKAGTTIVVADPGASTLAPVKSIDVDKATKSVTAYDADHKVLAVFPATVGSTERPSPKGIWKVTGVSQNPDYEYNPAKLTWGPKKAGKLHIPPGPHNPVGVVWIALSAKDYGIHGTPDPKLVGKTASHGCVRLTNWDAEELSKAVKPGVKVTFVSGKGNSDEG